MNTWDEDIVEMVDSHKELLSIFVAKVDYAYFVYVMVGKVYEDSIVGGRYYMM